MTSTAPLGDMIIHYLHSRSEKEIVGTREEEYVQKLSKAWYMGRWVGGWFSWLVGCFLFFSLFTFSLFPL